MNKQKQTIQNKLHRHGVKVLAEDLKLAPDMSQWAANSNFDPESLPILAADTQMTSSMFETLKRTALSSAPPPLCKHGLV